jgi:hypothetical protein
MAGPTTCRCEPTSLASSGFGVEVRDAIEARLEHLIGKALLNGNSSALCSPATFSKRCEDTTLRRPRPRYLQTLACRTAA